MCPIEPAPCRGLNHERASIPNRREPLDFVAQKLPATLDMPAYADVIRAAQMLRVEEIKRWLLGKLPRAAPPCNETVISRFIARSDREAR